MFDAFSPLAIIFLLIATPIFWIAEHPIAAGFIIAGLWFIGFSLHVQAVNRRARRKFEADYAADEHQKQLIREVMDEPRRRAF